MAKINSVAIGKASGSIGNVTFQGWKGIQTARQKPTEVANPNTVGQRNQRAKMTVIIAFFRSFASILSLGFKQLAVKKSAYNAFVQENLKNGAVDANEGVAAIDPTALVVAKGTLPATAIDSYVASAALEDVTVSWGITPQEGQSADDLINVLVIRDDGARVGTAIDVAARSEGSVQMTMDVNLIVGDIVNVYTFFRNPVTGAVSDSTYSQVTVVA